MAAKQPPAALPKRLSARLAAVNGLLTGGAAHFGMTSVASIDEIEKIGELLTPCAPL
ncbi:MAG: hypothetical protein ACE5EF_12800 [Dehalococcoidia bacterium]